MPYVESLLVRELDLRFIDARDIAAEARIALAIEGYPTKDQASMILDEAIRIFQSKPDKEQNHMRRMNLELEAIKTSAGSQSGWDCMDSSSSQMMASSEHSMSKNNRRGIMSVFRRH